MEKSFLTGLLVAVLSLVTLGQQETREPKTEPSPTPKPPMQRRAFDQFDLSSGIRVVSPQNTGSDTLVAPELVDNRTYEGIEQMIRYAARTESEYRASEGEKIDPGDHFEPNRILSRKLPALFRILEMFRAGLLDQPVMTNKANLDLLERNQEIISEMMMIVNSTEAQLARNQAKLVPIAERYAAPTSPVEKRPLLSAMFGKLNGNFVRLKSQISLAK